MHHSYETKLDAECAEMFVLSTHAYGIFFRALNKMLLLSQTTKCGMIVAKGLVLLRQSFHILFESCRFSVVKQR